MDDWPLVEPVDVMLKFSWIKLFYCALVPAVFGGVYNTMRLTWLRQKRTDDINRQIRLLNYKYKISLFYSLQLKIFSSLFPSSAGQFFRERV